MKLSQLTRYQKPIVVITAITAFWLIMMYLLIRREYFPEELDTITANYKQTLADIKEKKHRKMIVYYGTGPRFTVGLLENTVTPQLDGTFEIDTRCQFSLSIRNLLTWRHLGSLFGILGPERQNKFDSQFISTARIGPDFRLKEIRFRLDSNLVKLKGIGKVQMGKLQLQLEQNDQIIRHEMVMPDRAMLQQSLGVPTRFPEMRVGRKFRMQWFDPFTQVMRSAVAEVKGKMTYPWQGNVLTVYMVRTQSGPLKTVALVDSRGEIYEYRVFSFTFVRVEDGQGNRATGKSKKGKK